MANLESHQQSQTNNNNKEISEQEMLANGELFGKAMQGVLQDAFAQAVVNAALGDGDQGNKLQSLLASDDEEAKNELKKHVPNLELYTNQELKQVREHIEHSLGTIYLQVEDPQQDHIRCDIDIIKPLNQDDPIYLATKGMGAHKMPVPEEFKELNLQRAELYLALPSNWPIESELEQDSWPISLLGVLSRLPFVYDSWMAQGHIITFPKEESYAPNTDFAGAILVKNQVSDLKLSNSDQVVNFYQVVLLYEQEMAYAEQYSARTLMRLMDKSAYVCTPNRPLTKLKTPKHSS